MSLMIALTSSRSGGTRGIDDHRGSFGVVEDGAERLIELVRNRSRQLARSRLPVHVRQLGQPLPLLDIRFCRKATMPLDQQQPDEE